MRRKHLSNPERFTYKKVSIREAESFNEALVYNDKFNSAVVKGAEFEWIGGLIYLHSYTLHYDTFGVRVMSTAAEFGHYKLVKMTWEKFGGDKLDAFFASCRSDDIRTMLTTLRIYGLNVRCYSLIAFTIAFKKSKIKSATFLKNYFTLTKEEIKQACITAGNEVPSRKMNRIIRRWLTS